jgi:NAD-dependent SIR2 family protein deacetylase
MSTRAYSDRVKAAGRLLAEADFILIGAGAGLSAAAGLNYQDPELFQKWYSQFARLGLNTIWEAIVAHWAPNDKNRRRFWAFWAHHIQKMRYDAPPGTPYLHLLRLVSGKPHFVLTTNVDAQFTKAGFLPERVFTPQGDYGKFQCATPCNDILHDNRVLVQKLITNMDDANVLVAESDIPRCPACGDYLERNLRRDGYFVESPHMERRPAYEGFLDRSLTGRLVLLELGVGFNTPTIIRWPFERIASQHPGASLLRVNMNDVSVPTEIEQRSTSFREDAAQVIQDLLDQKGKG